MNVIKNYLDKLSGIWFIQQTNYNLTLNKVDIFKGELKIYPKISNIDKLESLKILSLRYEYYFDNQKINFLNFYQSDDRSDNTYVIKILNNRDLIIGSCALFNRNSLNINLRYNEFSIQETISFYNERFNSSITRIAINNKLQLISFSSAVKIKHL
uniref:Phycobiliprotein lyase n=1 Tax=Cyanidium sp. THAL103 TaxID=3027999 RepID=A0A9Y1I434_9RHOD|nr:phycobiliprotein lyase [Cyanidium sp. THAL103]